MQVLVGFVVGWPTQNQTLQQQNRRAHTPDSNMYTMLGMCAFIACHIYIIRNQCFWISEVGVYDVNKNLVAVGKMNMPIEKVPNSTIIIEIAFDL